MKSKKLPKTIFISIEKSGADVWFAATDTAEAAVQDNGPTLVGTYTLVESKILVKKVHEA